LAVYHSGYLELASFSYLTPDW